MDKPLTGREAIALRRKYLDAQWARRFPFGEFRVWRWDREPQGPHIILTHFTSREMRDSIWCKISPAYQYSGDPHHYKWWKPWAHFWRGSANSYREWKFSTQEEAEKQFYSLVGKLPEDSDGTISNWCKEPSPA